LSAVVFEAVFENLHANGLAPILPFEGGAGLGKTRIAPRSAGPLLRVGVCQRAPELARWSKPQIYIRGQVRGAIARPLTQVALRQRLQPPGDAPEQVGMVGGPRLFAEQFLVARLQRLGLLLAQSLNLLMNFLIHVVSAFLQSLFISLKLFTSLSMNARWPG